MPVLPLKTFIIYARADTAFKVELCEQLKPLEEKGQIEVWDDSHLLPGEEWGKKIREKLNTSDLVLLLVSASALNSPFIKEKELAITLERKERGVVQLVPILIRDCLWQALEYLENIQMLPLDYKREIVPVTDWKDSSSAWASSLRELIKLIPDIEKKIIAEKLAQEERDRIQREALIRQEAADKLESLRHNRDNTDWRKILSAIEKTDSDEEKIALYKIYLEDEELHKNHRVESQSAIDELEAELDIGKKILENRNRFKGTPVREKEDHGLADFSFYLPDDGRADWLIRFNGTNVFMRSASKRNVGLESIRILLQHPNRPFSAPELYAKNRFTLRKNKLLTADAATNTDRKNDLLQHLEALKDALKEINDPADIAHVWRLRLEVLTVLIAYEPQNGHFRQAYREASEKSRQVKADDNFEPASYKLLSDLKPAKDNHNMAMTLKKGIASAIALLDHSEIRQYLMTTLILTNRAAHEPFEYVPSLSTAPSGKRLLSWDTGHPLTV